MFKKFVASIMIAAVFSGQAMAASNSGLKVAFDELKASIELDGPSKENEKKNFVAFTSKIRELQNAGLTDAEVIAFVKSEVKDERKAKEFEAVLNLVSLKTMSAEQASKMISETIKSSGNAGASWNGDAVLYLGLGVLIVAAAVALAAAGYTGGNANSCRGDVYICDTTCYDDYYYGYTCYDDCYYGCY